MFKAVMRKYARIRYTYKEKPFFYRKIEYSKTRNIEFVKPPKAIIGKNHIPRNEDRHHYCYGREKILPLFIKSQLRMKTE